MLLNTVKILRNSIVEIKGTNHYCCETAKIVFQPELNRTTHGIVVFVLG